MATYEFILSKEFNLRNTIRNDSEMDGFRIHVRPGSQRVVIFYIKSRLYAYMKEKNITSEKALYELHKNMPYDDKYPDTVEDNDV